MSKKTLRDEFAIEAMKAMLFGAVGVLDGEVSAYAKGHCNAAIAERSYAMADEMLRAGGSAEDQENGLEGTVVIVGGPLDGHKIIDIGAQYFDHGDGQYHRCSLGIDNEEPKVAYAWSGLHSAEIISILLGEKVQAI